MVFIVLFWLIWIEQNRKNKYITLQRELMQKRSDTFLTAGDEAENEQNLDKLRKEKAFLMCKVVSDNGYLQAFTGNRLFKR